MYLNKLLLKEFGKFHNKEIDLKPGMNLIYGEKEAGKTTVKDFISGMLYGLDGAESRKPKNSTDFSGKAYMKDDNASYLIERTFFRNSTKTSVLDVQSGRNVKLNAPNTLQGTMLETDSQTYTDIMCITPAKKDAKEEVKDCLLNIVETGTTNIRKEKALAYLEAEKKKNDTRPLVRRLDELSAKIETYDNVDRDIEDIENELAKLDEEFAIEAAKRKRVARKLVENEDGSISYEADDDLDEKLNKLTATGHGMMNGQEEELPVKLTDRLSVIFATGLLVILVIAAIVYMMPFESAIRKLFIIFTVIFVIFTIIDGLRVKGFFSTDDISTPSEEDFQKVLAEIEAENEEREAIEFDMTFAKEYAEKKAELKEKANDLLSDRKQRNTLRAEFNSVFKKKSELEAEIRSINLAMATISRQSVNLIDKNKSSLNRYIASMVAGMTGGRYQNAVLDESQNVLVQEGNHFIRIETLSEGLADQIYLAVRLGIARALVTEQIPLVLDGVCRNYDEEQILNMLKCLESFGAEQILILSANRNIKDVFEKQAVNFQFAEL